MALVDTGFTGHLVIPFNLVQAIPGLPDSRTDWELADGSTVGAPSYLARMEILGLPSVPVLISALGEEYIVGRGVIDRFKVTFDHGQRVIVEL